ncbi:tRNA (adenosine(37)-N6)-dimethylallyltransferase MiaA [Candidatus Woesebacteria bacterium]|nr:tRNA (adenosine(37)-N6)-dimethylallyltransferase MiaA [Candidatus Woesebacteria bacterium]
MNKLICVVGPTATGKTKKAVVLSKQAPSILVSADSRQVYRWMDIVTGKDHPADFVLYGIDIVEPDEDCSVSVWHDAVMPHIQRAWDEGKQVIVVGGTGLYVKAITDGIETMSVPINQSLRDELSPLSITELQNKLKEVDEQKFSSMNNSDVNNPRRLIRAIEISISPKSPLETRISNLESNIIGLKYSDEQIHHNKVRERVLSRLESGAIEETKTLLSKYDPSLKSMTAIGYKSIISHLKGELSYDQMIENWVNDEMAYVKRQLTWFNKQPVIWYDVESDKIAI